MEERKIYKITLADGTEINNLTQNGNNYISATEVTENTFKGKLSEVTITDGTNTEVLHNAVITRLVEENGEYWFAFRELTVFELQEIKNRADIEYLAMMSDVNLEG